MKIMGYDIFIDNLDTIDLKKKQVINTINPHSYIVAQNDICFQMALKESDLLIPDGSGIVFAAKQIKNLKIKKIAGADLHNFLLEKMNEKNGKIFYMGASQDSLNKIENKIKNKYPNISVQSFSPPFKPKFTDEENNNIVAKINKFNPDVLFVGMTAPKQEKWLHEHKKKLHFKIASSIGAVFDFYAGTVERPSNFWIDLQLEWFVRFLKEPKRMWRRNFISTPLFLLEIFYFKIGLKK